MVLVDNAGGHMAKDSVVPGNVRMFHLPAGTPALQPAEQLGPVVREGMANREFGNLVALGAKLRRRCNGLAGHPGVVGFRWAVNL